MERPLCVIPQDGGALSRDELVSWSELLLCVLQDSAADSGVALALGGMGLSREQVYEEVRAIHGWLTGSCHDLAHGLAHGLLSRLAAFSYIFCFGWSLAGQALRARVGGRG